MEENSSGQEENFSMTAAATAVNGGHYHHQHKTNGGPTVAERGRGQDGGEAMRREEGGITAPAVRPAKVVKVEPCQMVAPEEPDQQQNGYQLHEKEVEDEDKVVAELGIYLLPDSPAHNNGLAHAQAASSYISFDRMLFPGPRTSGPLQQALDTGAFELKPVVKRMRVKMPSFQRQKGGIHHGLLSTAQTIGGTMDNDKDCAFYHGDGFPRQNCGLSHTFAFIQNGKLFLVPTQRLYDMRLKVQGAAEQKAKEAAEAKRKIDAEKMDTSSASEPIRVKFGKRETAAQKRRREASSAHKQRLINQDPWTRLELKKTHPTELYRRLIDRLPASSSTSSVSSASSYSITANGGVAGRR